MLIPEMLVLKKQSRAELAFDVVSRVAVINYRRSFSGGEQQRIATTRFASTKILLRTNDRISIQKRSDIAIDDELHDRNTYAVT